MPVPKPTNLISVLIETKVLARVKVALENMIPGFYKIKDSDEILDEDVAEEQQRVRFNGNGPSDDVLLVSNLEKKFKR